MLLFTAPSKDWDRCLYESGLYCRFEKAEKKNQVSGVVCLFNPGQASPSPLAACRGCQPRSTRSATSSTCSATRRGRFPTKGRWRPILTPSRWTTRLAPSRGHSALQVSTSTHFPWCWRCPSPTKSQGGILKGGRRANTSPGKLIAELGTKVP